MMAKYVDSAQREWDRALHIFVFAYNSSVQKTTWFRPFLLMFGRKPVLDDCTIERFLEI